MNIQNFDLNINRNLHLSQNKVEYFFIQRNTNTFNEHMCKFFFQLNIASFFEMQCFTRTLIVNLHD